MFALVGLGNPGERYARTRHNAGFWVVEELRRRWSADAAWRVKGGASFARGSVKQHEVLFVRPERYMNLSGEAAQPLLAFFKIDPAEIIVVHDELDIPTGEVRVKKGGGDGGHRGVSDLSRALGTKEFYRVRLGIGRPERRAASAGEAFDQVAFGGPPDVTSWVLGVSRGEEETLLRSGVQRAADAVEVLLSKGLESAQREFNRRIKPEPEEG